MLSALFYPKGTEDKPIGWDNLFIPYIYKEIYFDGIYIDIFNNKKDMTVIDVGANIGVVTQYMRDFAKHVYAIEPSSEHFEALQKNKEFNNWDNVSLHNLALDDHNGEETFYHNVMNRTSNSLVFEWGKDKDGVDTEKVKSQTFDTFFEENNIDMVDFVKFDVEGAEDVILRSEGFKKVAPKIKAIECEFHLKTWPDLVKYMESLGFTARRYDSSSVIILFVK